MELNQFIKNIRRNIHKNPEVGFETYETAKYVFDILNSLGFETKYAINKASVIATLNLNKEKTIAFRADMDALKITEEIESEYKSKNNCMHACGHDAHTAILLGLAKLLMENKNDLKNNIVLIFQCAEEGPLPGGAFTLLNENVLPNIDEIYALHVTNEYKTGDIAIKKGEAFSGADWFEFHITGRGGHGSMPELANNPIIASSKLILKINDYIEALRKEKKCAFTTCKIESGANYNVIPDITKIYGTIRFFNAETRNEIHSKAFELAKDIENEYNVNIKYLPLYGYIPLLNHKNNCDKILRIASESNLFKNIIELDTPTMVAEDFAYYLEKYNGCMFWLGVRNEEDEIIPLHSSKFNLNEDALENASRFFLELAKK